MGEVLPVCNSSRFNKSHTTLSRFMLGTFLIFNLVPLFSHYLQRHNVCKCNWVGIYSQEAVHHTRTQVPLRYCLVWKPPERELAGTWI